MPVYHLGLCLPGSRNQATDTATVLFKLKSDADPERVRRWQELAHSMVGKVPGLLELQSGSPVELTAPMARGFDMGVVVQVDYLETLATFFTHPSHDE
jgi:antibiotic biosynthesis monooxygenase (ABM) superfamily enzyme